MFLDFMFASGSTFVYVGLSLCMRDCCSYMHIVLAICFVDGRFSLQMAVHFVRESSFCVHACTEALSIKACKREREREIKTSRLPEPSEEHHGVGVPPGHWGVCECWCTTAQAETTTSCKWDAVY